jgi:predicted amidophosphoribosyltransferase
LNENETNARISKVEEKVQNIENAAQSTAKINGTEQSPLIEGTKICPYCGETIKQNAIKCRYCGAEIKEVHMVECPFCKELIRSDAVKCKYCRSDIPQSVEAEDETDDKQVD